MRTENFSTFQIIDARRCPEGIDSMMEWQRLQWGDQWVSHIQKQANSRPFEMFAAIHGESEIVGCALILGEEMGVELSPDPWLCGMIVSTHYRRLGIGGSLACHAKMVAKDLGFRKLWAQSNRSFELFEGLGWSFYERISNGKSPRDVLMLDLYETQAKASPSYAADQFAGRFSFA